MTSQSRAALPFRPAGVLFDLDGTLVDSAPDIAAAVNELLASEGLAPHSLPAVRGMIGHGLEKLVERAFAAHGIVLDQAALRGRHAAMADIYAHHLTDLTTLRPGAHEALRATRRSGALRAVVTNKPEGFTRSILAHFDLLDAMQAVIGGDSGYPKKPAPDMPLAACRGLGAPPDQTVLVGDSPADLAAARAAGIACVLVRGGYCDRPVDELGADLVIDDLAALPTAFWGVGQEACP
jgi:phosphoglycolate phosphatase